ncbi:hypothetical protein Tco_1131772 [Tanacetum coccineum]|uniref:Uncharacterized protein n=1 Tax=Tanacetum coccineum TaxID=301880 RepID=A0ABQ5JAP8_9ASTR
MRYIRTMEKGFDDDHDDDEKVQDDDEHDVDETVQEDDDEEQTESDADGDDFVHPKLTTHDDEIILEEDTDEDDSSISSSDEEDSDNEVEGTNVEGAKSDEEATYEEDQGNEAVKDTNTDLDGRDEVMTDVIFTPGIREESTTVIVNNSVIHSIEGYIRFNEVLVRSSKEANTSHAVAANLSELELKKILIDKMEANNSINRDGADIDQDLRDRGRGSKRRRVFRKRPTSTSASCENDKLRQQERTTVQESKTHKKSASQSRLVEECYAIYSGLWRHLHTRSLKLVSMMNKQKMSLAQQDPRGPTFELMKGTCKSLTELEYFCEEVYKATTEKLDWINPEGRQYPHDLRQLLPLVPNSQGRRVIPFHHSSITDLSTYVVVCQPNWTLLIKYDKFALWGISHWGKKQRKFYAFVTSRELARDVYSKRRIIAVTKVEIVEWHDYKHLDWIIVRRDDDALYNYQKNLAHKACTYISFMRRSDAYTPYIQSRGFIYENKDKKNRLMRIDELHKFSDGTLDDVRTALNDRLKGIRMEYLPQTFWSQRDKANARAMIQAIDKRLKTRRIMRSLERFVGGRPYEGDLRLLQRTI